MQVTYSKQADAMYIRFGEDLDGAVVRTEEVKPGLLLDYDHDGHLYGIELLDVSMKVPGEALGLFQVGILESAA
jgi:uncharacterized protein YuzE